MSLALKAGRQNGEIGGFWQNIESIMRRIILLWLAVFSSVAAFGQGAVTFNNRITGVVDVRLVLPDGTGAGTGWTAQLYGGAAGTATANLRALVPTTTFRTTTATAQGYVNAIDVVVPGVAAGARATLVMKAYRGTSFDTATQKYESNPFTITLGGGTLPPANMVGLLTFTLVPTASPPTITAHPQSYTLVPGSTVTFSVTATGTAPLTYQWTKSGAAIPGATSSTLVLNNVSTADLAVYNVTVSNTAGSVTSASVTLSAPVDLNNGAVNFNNRITGIVDVRVLLADGSGAGAGWTAQLFGGAEGAAMQPLAPTTTFRTTSAAATGYVNPVDVTVTGVKPNAKATLIMRVFNGSSFDTSAIRYESNPFTITLGGGTLPPANLVGLTSFKLVTDVKPFVERQLPGGYTPGGKITVVLQATPPATTGAYAVEDFPPANWVVGQLSDGGIYDAGNKKVKFGPFFDKTARALTYEVTAPTTESGRKTFNGTASVDGQNSAIIGMSIIDVAALHPADNNPANARISIEEVTAYGAAWRKGSTWPIAPNPIPIDYVTRAATLWKNGETYGLDAKITSAPLWWVNTSSVRPAGLRSFGKVITALSIGANSVVRVMPSLFVPGEPLTIHVSVAPATGTSAYAVQDLVPSRWTISGISHGGDFDPVNGLVKWGPFFDSTPRDLNFQLTPAPDAGLTATFEGSASFDGANVVTAGQNRAVATARLKSNSLTWKPNGEFQIKAAGQIRAELVIEATSDLKSWTQVPTTVAADGTVTFKDPAAGLGFLRFYRVSAQ